MMTPTTPAVFYGWDDKVVQTPLITLSAWVIALKGVVEHDVDVTGGLAEKSARETLGTPDDYPVADIYEHLKEALRQTKEHYGIT